MEYRKDIQVLRGVAVLLVVLYHFKIPGFGNGFLGVDIFFVISGFLMAVLYKNQPALDFYKRRALRLLPPYFVLILAVLGVSAFIVSPYEYSQVVEQSLYSSVFAANFGFWGQTSYFASEDFNPLLHLWSLGVEIQYYLIVPFLFPIIRKHIALFLVAFIGSMVACFVMLTISSKTSFFMMPFRIWEFLIGYGVATFFCRAGMPTFKQYAPAGLVSVALMFVIAFAQLTENQENIVYGHPGLVALLISVVTGVVLACGVPVAFAKTAVARFMEELGKYSYSIYLMHFPVITLYCYQPFSGTQYQTDTLLDLFYVFVITGVLSYASFHLLENGLRKFKRIIPMLTSAPALILFLGMLGYNVQTQVYAEEQINIANAFEDKPVWRCGKYYKLFNHKNTPCKLTEDQPLERSGVLLVGDSHMNALRMAFIDVANAEHVPLYFLTRNRSLEVNDSHYSVDEIVGIAKTYGVRSIVMHYSPNKMDDGEITQAIIENFVTAAHMANINMSFVLPVPIWDTSIPVAMWEHFIDNSSALPAQSIADYKRHNQQKNAAIRAIQANSTKPFNLYNPADYFCQPMCIYASDSGKPYYSDKTHLTISGAKFLEPMARKVLHQHLDSIKEENQKAQSLSSSQSLSS